MPLHTWGALRPRRFAAACATSWAVACPLTGQAQAAPDSAAEATTDPALPVLTVKAPRPSGSWATAPRAEAGVLGERPLVDTPFSIQVQTRELMDRQQAWFTGDVLKNDASVTTGNVAVPFARVRGFDIGNGGTLYDGMPGHGALTDGRVGLQAIERIDVLKGATAFLSGSGSAGSLGGVINYLPKRPLDEPVRSAAVGWGNRSLWSAEVDLGDRFGAERQFGARLNLGWRDGEQAVRRYDWNQQVAALALDWRASRDLGFNLELDHVANHLPELPPFYVVATGVDVPDAPDTTRSAAQPWDAFRTRATNLHLRSDWRLAPDWTLTGQLLAGQSERPAVSHARFGSVGSDTGDMVLIGSRDRSSARTESGQLLLRGKVAAAGFTHSITAGLSRTRQRFRYGSTPLGLFPSNLYDPIAYPEPQAATPPNEPSNRTTNASVLLSDLIDLSPQWAVLLGARRIRLDVDNYDGNPNRTTKTVPAVALMFRPMPGAMLYANHAEGLEQGGDRQVGGGGGGFLPARMTRQWELGAKLDRDGMSYTAALFDMRRPHETTFNGRDNVQLGTERHRGLELTATGRATAALTVSAGLMWLEAELSGTGSAALDGREVPGVPPLTAHVWAEYRLAAVPGLALNGGLYHTARQYLDGANSQKLAAWTRWDLGASYALRIGRQPATVQLNVENVADKRYWASAHGGLLTMADPRVVKLSLRTQF